MENKTPSHSNFVVSLVCFVLTTAIAILLLLTALVIWLSELIGSFTLSALIVGVFCALLAVLFYFLGIRGPVEQFRTQIETVYDVAHTAKMGYEWITEKVSLFLKLREQLRKE